ncbi:MAG: energy transducer TonB [Bacteroidetes bacterium]|nr:energy transducer TonB [Bacteroidota bacterium]
MNKFDKNTERRKQYSVHILATSVLSLLAVNAAILFWPSLPVEENALVFDSRGQEVIQVEEIQQTKQEKSWPAPTIPAPPVILPNEFVLEEVELEIADVSLSLDAPGRDTQVVKGTTTGASVASRADSSPSPVRIAVGEYTKEAERKKIKAEIVVEVMVNEAGKVGEARVIERYLLNKDMTERELVNVVGYGLEDSAVEAAKRYLFSPAWKNNKRVSSYTTLTFRFGV